MANFIFCLVLAIQLSARELGWFGGTYFFFENADILKDLDILEDYQSDRNQRENEYQRKLIEIYKQENQNIEKAWAYLMKLEKIKSYGGIPIESGNFN